jgi:hypothetical protein
MKNRDLSSKKSKEIDTFLLLKKGNIWAAGYGNVWWPGGAAFR